MDYLFVFICIWIEYIGFMLQLVKNEYQKMICQKWASNNFFFYSEIESKKMKNDFINFTGTIIKFLLCWISRFFSKKGQGSYKFLATQQFLMESLAISSAVQSYILWYNSNATYTLFPLYKEVTNIYSTLFLKIVLLPFIGTQIMT